MDLAHDCKNFFFLENYSHSPIFEGCHYPWEALKRLKEYLYSLELGKIQGKVCSGAYLTYAESISIGEGTIIEPGASIQGPCSIGKRCVIRQGAYIRGDVLIGDDCVIGHATEIKHSIFLNQVSAPHFNYVGDSILGNECNLGAGAICSNVRFDRKTIWVEIAGERLDTGLKKLGAIICDGAQVGCNCVINPGTILGKSSVCFPCLNISGSIPENGKVYRK